MRPSKRIRSIAVISALLALAVGEASAQDSSLTGLLRRMDAHTRGLSSLRAEVTMSKINARLGDEAPEISFGTVLFAKGSKKGPLLRLDWRKPEESLALIDGTFYMYRPKLNVAYTGPISEVQRPRAGVDPRFPSVLSFMRMSKTELDENFSVSLLSDKAVLRNGTKTFHLLLTPKLRMQYKTAELWVDDFGMPVQLKVNEHNNDSTTVLLTDLEKNAQLKKSYFKIEWKSGTTVRPL